MSDESDEPIPALFATIHHRSAERPDGYAPEHISWLNVIANKHIPALYEELLTQHRRAFPDHQLASEAEGSAAE